MSDDQGNKFPATVMEIKEDKVKLDLSSLSWKRTDLQREDRQRK